MFISGGTWEFSISNLCSKPDYQSIIIKVKLTEVVVDGVDPSRINAFLCFGIVKSMEIILSKIKMPFDISTHLFIEFINWRKYSGL